jgi:deazaflavin-dependent oxidoreductase (nitroreductase family)
MFEQVLSRLESDFYRGLNGFVEPIVRAGFGSPVLWPTGAIVLESAGRKTGQSFNVPLLATRVGDLIVVSTYRRRSQWVKNLAARAETRYWMGGRLHEATAYVLTPDREPSPSDELPPRAACLAAFLKQQSRLFGISFAILTPRD